MDDSCVVAFDGHTRVALRATADFADPDKILMQTFSVDLNLQKSKPLRLSSKTKWIGWTVSPCGTKVVAFQEDVPGIFVGTGVGSLATEFRLDHSWTMFRNISGAALTEDGTMLALQYADTAYDATRFAMYLAVVKFGEGAHTIQLARIDRQHRDHFSATAMCASRYSNTVAIAYAGVVKVMCMTTGLSYNLFRTEERKISCLRFSRTGDLLVGGTDAPLGDVLVWNCVTSCVFEFPDTHAGQPETNKDDAQVIQHDGKEASAGGGGGVVAVCISDDSKWIASAGRDGKICLFEYTPGNTTRPTLSTTFTTDPAPLQGPCASVSPSLWFKDGVLSFLSPFGQLFEWLHE